MWCQIVPGNMVPCWVLSVLLYGGGGGGVVFRCPSVRIMIEGVEGDGVVVFPAVVRRKGVEAVPGPPGWAGVGPHCRFQKGVHGAIPGVFPEKVVFWARPVLPASTPGGSRGSLGVPGGRIGSIARRPWGGLGCWPVWLRWPLGGGGWMKRGSVVGFLLLVVRVLIRGGCGGYGAGLHGVVGFLRFLGLLVGM